MYFFCLNFKFRCCLVILPLLRRKSFCIFHHRYDFLVRKSNICVLLSTSCFCSWSQVIFFKHIKILLSQNFLGVMLWRFEGSRVKLFVELFILNNSVLLHPSFNAPFKTLQLCLVWNIYSLFIALSPKTMLKSGLTLTFGSLEVQFSLYKHL